jgi:hypothetical protein
MRKAVVSSGNATGIAGALIVALLGVLLCLTGIGALVGIPMVICALFMGGKRRKVWKCQNCGYVFDRV